MSKSEPRVSIVTDPFEVGLNRNHFVAVPEPYSAVGSPGSHVAPEFESVRLPAVSAISRAPAHSSLVTSMEISFEMSDSSEVPHWLDARTAKRHVPLRIELMRHCNGPELQVQVGVVAVPLAVTGTAVYAMMSPDPESVGAVQLMVTFPSTKVALTSVGLLGGVPSPGLM